MVSGAGLIKIHVENFKSLRDFQITLDSFNVLIGSNGSGKTNVLELFKFANLCVDPHRIPAYQFGAWSGFGNIVWRHNTDLPIRLRVEHSAGGHCVEYAAALDGSSGRLEYLDEILAISDYITVTRSLEDAEVKLDPKFLKRIGTSLGRKVRLPALLGEKIMQASMVKISPHRSILPYLQGHVIPAGRVFRYPEKRMRSAPSQDSVHYGPNDIGLFFWHPENLERMLIPTIKVRGGGGSEPFIHRRAVDFLVGSHPIILLRQLNYAALREAPPVEHNASLEEDGTGLVSMLFQWYTGRTGLPDRFTLALESLFPKWQISFDVTNDGRILLNVHDGGTYLRPPSIPDGFYKLLAILAAVEIGPKLLLIDGIDSSLHAKMIEYVLGELRTCGSNVIITTHSPAVIDAVGLEDLVLLERTDTGTSCRRIKDPKMLGEKLNNLGVTASEGWLYGRL